MKEYELYRRIYEANGLILNEETTEYKHINHPYDKSFRKALDIKSEAVWLINNYLGANSKISEDDIEKYNSSFISKQFKNLESDVIYKIKNKDVFFIIEHQTKVDYSMPLRILEYERAIIFSCLNDKNYKNSKYRFPAIIPIVLYTGKSKWNAPLDLKSKQEHYGEIYGEELSRYKIFDNNKFSNEELLAENKLLTQLILLERAKDEEQLEKNLNEIIKQVKNSTNEEYSEQKKEVLSDVLHILLRRILGNEKVEEYLNKLNEEGEIVMEAVFEMIEREEKKKKIKYERIGKDKGRREVIIKHIKNMLAENLSLELISKITGLSMKEIEKI